MDKEFLCSDETVNTYGFRVLTDGIKIDRFLSNPVMLYRHYESEVIGLWDKVEKRDRKLYGTPVFDTDDPEAAKVAGKVERNFIRMCSIGLIPEKVILDADFLTNGDPTPTVVSGELKEISITPFGSNKNALALYDRQGKQINLEDKQAILQLCDHTTIFPGLIQSNLLITKNMELNKILQLSDKATDVEVATAVQAVLTERDSLKTEKVTLTDRAEKAEQKVQEFEAAEKAALKQEAITLTDSAIAAGKIVATAKTTTLEMFAKDHAGAKAMLAAIPTRQTAQATIEHGRQLSADDQLLKLSWDELDKKGLLTELKLKDKGLFEQKFEQRFGCKPKNQ